MRRLVKLLVPFVVVVAGSGFAAWYFLFKTDPAPRAKIKETATVAAPGAALDGTYSVKPGNTDNFVGYRVTEKLVASIFANTATGRTDSVTGTLTITGNTVSNVTVTADLRSLTSDQGGRDGTIQNEGLESNRFPQAKFVLTQPITLAAVPAVGQTITTHATGNFTLHGVTKKVTFDVVAKRVTGAIRINGSIPVTFADYNINNPSGGPASVGNSGTMEFTLVLTR